MKKLLPILICAAALSPALRQTANAQGLTTEKVMDLRLRNIGPSVEPGRVQDITVDPKNHAIWYIATASSGLWKTSDGGVSFEPVFDKYGSYSLGCVVVDPNNSKTVWLGSGENQALRSVSFGDGLYKSTDGGETWTRMGLEHSEHIARILVDPRNSDVVYVAAQGPLWASGGDRGLYKTTDGGKTWKAALSISENTGVSDAVFDPRNPDVIYAAAYQRQRKVGALVGGGPEAGVFKTTDAGATWTKLTNGLPTVDLGRIAVEVSPQQPDVVYAVVTAADRQSGFFRSADKGETWVRQKDFQWNDPQYYGEVYADPHKFDRLYLIDITIRIVEDGGKQINATGWRGVHTDNHAIWPDPSDPNHLLVGNDGGLYESWNKGETWRHFTMMPTMQFYSVAADNAVPFYNVYAGAQDNGSVGGPSRTMNRLGVRTSDWMNVGGGDGMTAAADQEDSSTVYTSSQNGAVERLNMKTGETKGIRPGGAGGGGGGGRGNGGGANALRFHWTAPYIISPHSHTRLYIGANMLFRSDDRGDNWKAISPDLTRHEDRMKIPLMGKTWGQDAVTRNLYTTDYGVITSVAESTVKEGLLVVGTDDGLVQISEDGGANWRKIDSFPGIPDKAWVSCVYPSRHDVNTLYVSFNNYMQGDFKPYLIKSTDLGKTWTSVAGTIPDRYPVWRVVQDRINPDLLFAGTEFGLFFTVDGGKEWTQLKGDVPTTAFRDVIIQERENDLVCATFGRGIFILDDYSALRQLTPKTLAQEGAMLPLRNPYSYYPNTRTEAFYGLLAMPNPNLAEFTYYLKDDITTDAGKIVITVADSTGKEVRRLDGVNTAGLHRIAWDLRGPGGGGFGRGRGGGDNDEVQENEEEEREEAEAEPESAQEMQATAANNAQQQRGGGEATADQPAGGGRAGRGGRGGGRGGRGGGGGALSPNGKYTVTLGKLVGDKVTPIGDPRSFEIVPLPMAK